MGTDVDAMRAFVGEGIPQQLPIHPGYIYGCRPCSKEEANSWR